MQSHIPKFRFVVYGNHFAKVVKHNFFRGGNYSQKSLKLPEFMLI